MDKQEWPALPLSGIAILMLLLGAILIQEVGLKGTRPSAPSITYHPTITAEEVPARLWEDPFEAVRRYRATEDDAGDRLTELMEAITQYLSGQEVKLEGLVSPDETPHRRSLAALAEKIGEAGVERTTVLGVSVFGGPYPEDRERRLRTRYAVLAGLGTLGYTPEDSAHIGYVVTENAEALEADERLPDVIPYEWLQQAGPQPKRVLVLWLDDELMAPAPLKKLARLLNDIEFELPTPPAADGDGPALRFRLVGPAGSTTLLAMSQECCLAENDDAWQSLRDMLIVSPSATAANYLLSAETGMPSLCIDEQLRAIEGNGQFFRTIRSDLALANALIAELRLRGIDTTYHCEEDVEDFVASPAALERNHVVILSEWDTFYGRAMPAAFIDAVKANSNIDIDEPDPTWIHHYTYLRGLDGSASDYNARAEQNAKDAARASNGTVTIERAVGSSQFDYLRRLAERIHMLDEDLQRRQAGRVAAIGILGSDVYDKLLALQALRPRFPDAVFFTTDLDARLLHPAEFDWTRNLIVASSFGLQLHARLQADIPPFRDSYQTSRYFSTLLALGADLETVDQGDFDLWLRPQVFEIGRGKAFALSENQPLDDELCITELGCLGNIYPSLMYVEDLFDVERKQWAWALVVLAILTGVALAYHYLNGFREEINWYLSLISTPKGFLVPVIALMFVIPLVLIPLVGITKGSILQEPFSITGGVSIWPTEFLRILAGLLAFYFIVRCYRILEKSNDEIVELFFPETYQATSAYHADGPPYSKGLRGWLPRKREAWRLSSILAWRAARESLTARHDSSDVEIDRLWRNYTRLGAFPSRMRRVVPWVFVFMLFSFALIYITGQPMTPYRGESIEGLNMFITIAMMVVPFVILLLSVVDATRLNMELMEWLMRARLRWPQETVEKFEEELCVNFEDLREWLGVILIARRTEAVGRLVYYPFIVLFVMIVSRSSYFDNWKMPLGLIVVIMVSSLYAIVAAFALRKVAERARDKALIHLAKRRLRARSVPGEKGDAHTAQIETLIEEVTGLREGVFRPWLQQPAVQALFWFLGGAGLAGVEFWFRSG